MRSMVEGHAPLWKSLKGLEHLQVPLHPAAGAARSPSPEGEDYLS